MIKRLMQNYYWWSARIVREFHPAQIVLMRCVFCGRGVIEGCEFCCEQLEKFCREKDEVRDGISMD